MQRRTIHILRPADIMRTLAPKRHRDGGCLYLAVQKNQSRNFVFLYMRDGAQHEIGLGGFSDIDVRDIKAVSASLDQARKVAASYREMLKQGIPPQGRREVAKGAKAEATGGTLFGPFADQIVIDKTPGWRAKSNADEWRRSVEIHAAALRGMRVDRIEPADIANALRPVWLEKQETATRTLARIGQILDIATAKKLRTGDNPAPLARLLLPDQSKLEQEHHAAMPYGEIPGFLAGLRRKPDVCARALEFLILTASRAGEARMARWSEIDLAGKLWTITPDRMKAGRTHIVPLSDRAVELLRAMPSDSDEIFAGCNMRWFDGLNGATVHGFRSSFRVWAAERTTFSREACEQALAHKIGSKTEAAYDRSNRLDERRKLMAAWADHCG